MPNRFLLIGLASLLFACSDSDSPSGGADVSSGWFGLLSGQGSLSVSRSGSYEFLLQSSDEGRATIKRSAGELTSSVQGQLKALLTTDLVNHYYENRTVDEQRCRDEGGYSLVHFGGCWIVDEVTDDKTKKMLDVLVPLYEEKEAEAIEAPDADSDAAVPPMTTLGTPHR